MSKNSTNQSWFDNFKVGFIIGSLEPLITNPLTKAAFDIQQGKKPQLKGSYKGVLPNMVGNTLTIGLTHATNQYIQNTRIDYHSLAGFFGGVVASPLSCVVEKLMISHGNMGGQFWSSAKLVWQQNTIAALFKGLPVTALRDGGFSMAWLQGTPWIKKQLPANLTDGIKTPLAGCAAGILASVATHPLDTIKTNQQVHGLSFFNTTHAILKHQGVFGFFNGTLFRTSSIMISITMLSWLKEKLDTNFSSIHVNLIKN
jgi:hypothetical protein